MDKLIQYFFENTEKEYHVRELAKLMNKSPTTVSKHLSLLKQQGILTSKKKFNHLFYMAADNLKFKDLKFSYNLKKIRDSGLMEYLVKNYNLENKQWVLVTIDPERDTPEDIDKYAKGFDDDFIGVSNERPMLLSLATQLSVNNVMPSMNNDMDHTHLDNHVNSIILLNPKGEYVGLFRPPFSTSRLSLTYQSVTQD